MRNLSFIFLVGLLYMFSSCKEEIKAPDGGFSWYHQSDYNSGKTNPNPAEVQVKDKLIFEAQSNTADYYVVWPGDKGHDYTKRNISEGIDNPDSSSVILNSTGVTLIEDNDVFQSKSAFRYSYPGEYMIYFVSRNINTETMDYEETIDSSLISVVDTLRLLFPPSGDDPNYKFVITSPSELVGVEPEVEGSTVKINAPAGTDVDNVKIRLQAGRSLIFGDEVLPPDNRDRIYFNGNLNTPKTVTVTTVDTLYSRDYTLEVAYGDPSSECDLESFSANGYDAEIVDTEIDIDLPTMTNREEVSASFTVSSGASVEINGSEIESGSVIDISAEGTVITVIAQDGVTEQEYLVDINSVDTEMTRIDFTNLNPVVGKDVTTNSNSVSISVLNGTDLENLVPTLTMTKFASAFYVNSADEEVDIVNGETAIDFTTGPVDISVYTDNEADTVMYSVSVNNDDL
ncbi:MAG: hypothetical protein R6U95_09615 [Bacteroidales bacterium]